MFIKKGKGPLFVTLDDGRKISRADLPPRDTKRWVAARKAMVAHAVRAGLLEMAEACDIYNLSEEELQGWISLLEAHGDKALKSTFLQKYRQP
ncbi:MAG: DUF1153 domain-containing protein [Rhodobacteraceae bacterium]|nr:DUF1153 domain-containing protein [Paracoccaceae bacterium]